ncbi:hypothetical protein J6590_084842 [Homalodisca vitripennis]|nr:hypothetical protein J6590_084842 [Homalodisca vitripennis]
MDLFTKDEVSEETAGQGTKTIALRIASYYRTVLTGTSFVKAGLPPLELLVKERMAVHDGRDGIEVRMELISKWTWKLIQDLRPWQERQHVEFHFHLTQFLFLFQRTRSDDEPASTVARGRILQSTPFLSTTDGCKRGWNCQPQ